MADRRWYSINGSRVPPGTQFAYSLSEIRRRSGFPMHRVKELLGQGMPPLQLIGLGITNRKRKKHRFLGERLTLLEIAEVTGTKIWVIELKLSRGYTLEEAAFSKNGAKKLPRSIKVC